jgi:hypothetical protein
MSKVKKDWMESLNKNHSTPWDLQENPELSIKRTSAKWEAVKTVLHM